MYDPAGGEPDLREAAVAARIRDVVGDPGLALTIKSVNTWQINEVIAGRYSEGRVFGMGDAVHRHAPANGLGMNTGIQDAYNLAWKLAYVLRGQAAPALLDTYTAERQPVGQHVVERATDSMARMAPIADVLSFAPQQSKAEGWANLAQLHEDSPAGRQRRARLRAVVKDQDIQFHAHGVKIGQRYRAADAAVCPDGTPESSYERDP